MRNISILLGALLLMDVSPSGHVKTDEEPNMARIEQYSGMNVFVAVADGVKTVIVMEGDSVTLNTSVTEIKSDDTILWMFGDDKSIIANMNEAGGIFSTKEDERFGDGLELDKQTGSLTIRNIRTEHTGFYQLKIKSTTETSKRFSVTVRDDVVSVSLMEGDTVTLQTGVIKIERDDQILWRFGDRGALIAHLNGTIDARWINVIKLSDVTRDLTIRNIQTEHAGDYELEINNSTTISHRTFRVAVSELPQSSHWVTVGIVVVGVIVIVAGIGICIMKKKGCIKVSCSGESGNQKTSNKPTQEEDRLACGSRKDGGTDGEVQPLKREAQQH